MKQYPVRRGAHEFKSRATQREWDGDCPPVRAVCAGSFLSIRCGGSFWLVGAIWSKERILGKFRSFRGVHGRGDVSLPQFIDSAVCVGSYRRGDTLWDIAYHRLQNTNGLRPLRSSPFVICYRHGHRSWHQDAIRLFGLLGSRCSILTKSGRPSGRFKSGCASFFQILWRTTWTTFEDVCSLRTGYFGKRRNGFSKFRTGLPRVLTCPKTSPFTTTPDSPLKRPACANGVTSSILSFEPSKIRLEELVRDTLPAKERFRIDVLSVSA